MGRVKGRIGKDIWPTVVRGFRLQLWVLCECTSRSGEVGLCRTIPTCPSCSRGEQGSKRLKQSWAPGACCLVNLSCLQERDNFTQLTELTPNDFLTPCCSCPEWGLLPQRFLKARTSLKLWFFSPTTLREKAKRRALELTEPYYGLIKVGELSFCFKYILHTHLRSVWGREGHYVVFRQRHRLYNNSF